MRKLSANQLKLASQASLTARKIYASLPFEYRFGVMLEHFSDAYDGTKDMIARIIYSEFLKAGVPGMVINGQPGEELQEKAVRAGRNAWKLIPKGYGGQYARKLFGMIRKKLQTEDLTEEFVGELMLMLAEGNKLHIDGSDADSLKSAESYVAKFVAYRLIDFLRAQGRRQRREVSMDPGGSGSDDEQPKMEFEDPRSMSWIVNRLDAMGDEAAFIRDLKRVDPRNPDRAVQYVQFKADGYTNQQIADEWWPDVKVNKGSMADWVRKYLPEIKKVFDKYVWRMSEAV